MTNGKDTPAESGPSQIACNFVPVPGADYKLIYLAQRNPALMPEEFGPAWRAHAIFAGSFASSLGKHFLGSRQCVRNHIHDIDTRFTTEFDGSTILSMKSWPDLLAARYHPHALDELEKDEARVFAGPVDNWTMAVEQSEITAGETTDHVLLAFLAMPLGADYQNFFNVSHAAASTLAKTFPDAQRIVWNRVVDPAQAYSFAVIVEIWLPDEAHARIAATNADAITALAQADIADASQSVLLFARINLPE